MGKASRAKRGRLTGPASTANGRLEERVRRLESAYPKAFEFLDWLHDNPSREAGWSPHPSTTWGPAVAGAYDFIRGQEHRDRKLSEVEDEDAVVLAATTVWRYGRGIYLFDQTLAEELWGGEPVDELPSEVLWRLPEWGLYLSFEQDPTSGCYAALEWEPYTSRPMLALTTEHPYTHHTIDRFEIYLDTATIAESTEEKVALHRRGGKSEDELRGMAGYLATLGKLAAAFLPLVTYLCSADPDIVRRDGPAISIRPRRPARTVERPTVWQVGWRIGPALLEHRSANASRGGTHGPPRSHIRRAHYHHYWTGPKDGERTLVVRWLHPILVAGGVEDLSTVVRPTE